MSHPPFEAMTLSSRGIRAGALHASLLLLLIAPMMAQGQGGDPPRGVHLGLTYQAGTKPGVVVMSVEGKSPDSMRAILNRDFDYGDRFAVVNLDDAGAQAL